MKSYLTPSISLCPGITKSIKNPCALQRYFPFNLISLLNMKDVTIGIDIGGTNTKFGVVDREGKVYHHGNIRTTDFEDFQKYFDAMADALHEVINTMQGVHKLQGI